MDKGTGICKNCGRERFLIAGLCGTCLKAARGLKGEDREKALADVKERIASGDVCKGRVRKTVKTDAPAQPIPDPAPSRLDPIPAPAQLPVGMPGSEIPVTIRLQLEIAVRVV